jgi:hypothetical protein
MSYKLLVQMLAGHRGEQRISEVLNTKELTLEALYNRRAKLSSYAGSRIQHFENLSGRGLPPTTTLAQVDQEIARVKAEVVALGGEFDEGSRKIYMPRKVENVQYDYTLEQQGFTRVYIGQIPGRPGPYSNLLRFKGGDVVDTSGYPAGNLGTSRPGRGIYVMSASGNFHIDRQVPGVIHHSTLLAGGRISCGGEIEVIGGRIRYINNNSGHYEPNILHFLQVLHELSKRVPMNFTVAAWNDAAGNVVEGPDPDGLMRQFFGVGDFEELYDYYNLLGAYSTILNNPDLMNSLGLIWKPTDEGRTLRGIYKVGAPGALSNVRISFKEARHIINQAANTNRLPQSRGVGTNRVMTDAPGRGQPRPWEDA